MSDVAEHYERVLARHYTWMLGPDFERLVVGQETQLADLVHAVPGSSATALDLGCGSGLQSLALARLGFDEVIAVDSSATLLAELERRTETSTAIRTVRADFAHGLDGIVPPTSVATVVCMGDTLPHLPSRAAVERVLDDVFRVLVPGGRLVLTFRDLTVAARGLDRFLPVRSDDSTILTCFLEDVGDRIKVHDLVYVRSDDGSWDLHKSSYFKLRLAPDQVGDQLARIGFEVSEARPGERGMWVLTARRPEGRVTDGREER
ncbi:class I SAM-dependent methyltransferase [Solicola gregarius]|uniref:Class I SAM-dependent methyltransferase n=1 Tax=Solicola gregarius TaxID=2908642 RepID=A0AA46TJU6_9ACTN|nr:class I SAM-dependent methyltransferase [Solicola gregarius]UYM05783.1 class I SAM-dependent methyltransferase [Solicola gregarius]